MTTTRLSRERPASIARSSTIGRVLKHGFLILLLLVMLYPMMWLLASSLNAGEGVLGALEPFLGPFTFDNYVRGWTALPSTFGQFLVNSAILSVGAIIGNVVSCSMAGYAFARLRFRGRKILFTLMIATLLIPLHVMIIPRYLIFNSLGWVNTFLPILVPKLLAVDAFFVFLMVQFVRGLPRELDDAAALDGCGPIRTFIRVILPLCVPAIGMTAIFTFIWTWNDFFSQLIYLSSPTMYTVPLGLQSFMDVTTRSSYGPLFAMSALSLGPIIGFFIVFQRYLVRGIATTGLK